MAEAYFVCHIGPNFQISNFDLCLHWVSVVRAFNYREREKMPCHVKSWNHLDKKVTSFQRRVSFKKEQEKKIINSNSQKLNVYSHIMYVILKSLLQSPSVSAKKA